MFLKCFIWKLCKCSCWLIIEGFYKNARFNNKIYNSEFFIFQSASLEIKPGHGELNVTFVWQLWERRWLIRSKDLKSERSFFFTKVHSNFLTYAIFIYVIFSPICFGSYEQSQGGHSLAPMLETLKLLQN